MNEGIIERTAQAIERQSGRPLPLVRQHLREAMRIYEDACAKAELLRGLNKLIARGIVKHGKNAPKKAKVSGQA